MSAAHMPAVVFRPMHESDLDAVMAIEPTIYSHPWTRGNFEDSLRAGYSCWVMLHEGGIVGYGALMIAMDEAHLLNLSVAASWQGRGMGSALLQHFITVARRHGAKTMFLEVRRSNIPAITLYERMGFNEFSVRKGYYPSPQGGREDAILMGRVV